MLIQWSLGHIQTIIYAQKLRKYGNNIEKADLLQRYLVPMKGFLFCNISMFPMINTTETVLDAFVLLLSKVLQLSNTGFLSGLNQCIDAHVFPIH